MGPKERAWWKAHKEKCEAAQAKAKPTKHAGDTWGYCRNKEPNK